MRTVYPSLHIYSTPKQAKFALCSCHSALKHGILSSYLVIVNLTREEANPLPLVPSIAQNKTVVPVVLPLSWVTRLNRLAVERGVNRSALIRQALVATFGVDQPELPTPRHVSAAPADGSSPIAESTTTGRKRTSAREQHPSGDCRKSPD
jgi:hypothetical protein